MIKNFQKLRDNPLPTREAVRPPSILEHNLESDCASNRREEERFRTEDGGGGEFPGDPQKNVEASLRLYAWYEMKENNMQCK